MLGRMPVPWPPYPGSDHIIRARRFGAILIGVAVSLAVALLIALVVGLLASNL